MILDKLLTIGLCVLIFLIIAIFIFVVLEYQKTCEQLKLENWELKLKLRECELSNGFSSSFQGALLSLC